MTKIKDFVQHIKYHPSLSLNNSLFDFKEGYRLTLTNGEKLTTFNVANTLGYVIPRMPTEIFSGANNIEIILTNNHQIFADTKKDELRRSKSRKRWHVVKNDNKKGKTTIYLQIRDEKLGDTDLTEIMSNLAIFHLLKKADYSQIWQHVVGDEGFAKQEFDALKDAKSFENWKNKNITVTLDFDEKRKSVLDILVERLSKKLPETEKKPFLMIGNDFSWRLMMFTLFLNGEFVQRLENLFAKEYEEIEVKLKERNIRSELKNFIKKYVLLTLLNKNYHKNDKTQEIYKEIFSQKNYKELGFTRLFYGERGPIDGQEKFDRSIIAEPVDYWDPNKFNRFLLEDEDQYVKNLFSKLIDQGQPILSIPYMIGQLSADLVAKLIDKKLIDQEKIGFIGKVGNIVRPGKNQLKRGQIVIPEIVYKSWGDKNPLTYPNLFKMDNQDLVFIDQFSVVNFMTVPAVTLQSYNDFDIVDATNLCAEMEQHPLVEMLEGTGIRIISSFYISDLSIEPNKGYYQEELKNQVNITIPLDTVEGAIAVALTTLFEVTQLTKVNEK